MSAGYCDNALFIAGQYNAYPTILSQQFSLVGGGAFSTPLMSDNIGGLLFGGSQIQGSRLYLNGSNVVSVIGTPTTEITNHLIGPFNNMSVPGAKSFHLLAPAYGNVSGIATGQANPYFVRFASSPTTTVLADAAAQNGTFFSLWIGNNDVLNYATAGGIGANQTGNLNPNTYGANDITDPTVFANVYSALLNNLTTGGAKGVVANIPNINTLPFFTKIPYNILSAEFLGSGNISTGQSTISTLNSQLYDPLHNALTFLGQGNRINSLSSTGGNPILIRDETLTNLSSQLTAIFTPNVGATTATLIGQIFGQARQTTTADLILLPTQSVIGTSPVGVAAPFNVYGITYPLEDKHILIPTEITEVSTATNAYNNTIQAQAAARGLAFVDVNSLYNQVNNGGIVANGLTLTSTFLTGGMFSLDGVHLSPRGNALMSNKFLQAINSNYGSNLQGVNIGNYPVLFPGNL
jgi:lysophospholipase L1-like esterase